MSNLQILVAVAGLGLIAWILNLVRRDRMYVGYGVLFLVSIAGTLAMVLVPGILAFVTRILGSPSPMTTVLVLALLFILVMLVYILGQVTLISNRVTALVQELAIGQVRLGDHPAGGLSAGAGREPAPPPNTAPEEG